MKSKKRPSKLPKEWEVIPNTHKGIVTQAQFDTVQRLMTSRRRDKGGSGFDNIFSGILKCADCGYAMRAMSANRRKRPDPIDCVQYVCNNYGANGTEGCSAHTIEARDLFDAVLADIRHYARLAVEGDEKRVRQLQEQLSSIGATEQKALEREKRKLSKRLGELDKLFSALYEDKVMERITERNFDMVSRKYETEQAQRSARIEEINASLAEKETSDNGVTDFFSLIAGYADAVELSFESFSKEFRITLKGALTHTTGLGTDIFGNILRLDNLLGSFEERLIACWEQLENVNVQLASAKREVEKPFPQEDKICPSG